MLAWEGPDKSIIVRLTKREVVRLLDYRDGLVWHNIKHNKTEQQLRRRICAVMRSPNYLKREVL